MIEAYPSRAVHCYPFEGQLLKITKGPKRHLIHGSFRWPLFDEEVPSDEVDESFAVNDLCDPADSTLDAEFEEVNNKARQLADSRDYFKKGNKKVVEAELVDDELDDEGGEEEEEEEYDPEEGALDSPDFA